MSWGSETASTRSEHQWRVRYGSWNNSRLADTGARAPRGLIQADYRETTHRGGYRLHYEHQPIRIREGEPAHNGYLHRVGGDWHYLNNDWELSLGGGLHASSNLFRHGRFHRQALVGRFAASYRTSASTGLGLAGDYRFGGFRVYPRFIYRLEWSRRNSLTLDMPRGLHLQWADVGWRLALERHGTKWGALDKDRQIKSAIYLQEWRLSSRYRYPLSQWLFVQAELGLSFDTRIRYRDLSQGEQARRLDDSPFASVALGLEW